MFVDRYSFGFFGGRKTVDGKSFLAATSPIALTALAIENNEEKNGSDHHSKEARRAT